ncbi:hypothetical protein BC829DRAFT_182751 [Chytridium lagenaria]|nr:hypothetical protein BC829DRAFT_182751 [Chytridium lagenaria]
MMGNFTSMRVCLVGKCSVMFVSTPTSSLPPFIANLLLTFSRSNALLYVRSPKRYKLDSKVLPVDHEVPPNGFHLGPQLRNFYDVVQEHPVDVAICKLDPQERRRLMSDPQRIQSILLEFYRKYEKWGYPLNPLPQFAAASPVLFNTLVGMRNAVDVFSKKDRKRDGTESGGGEQKVFCSEMVALACRDLGLRDFALGQITPPEFTPVELNAMPSFKTWFYVRIRDVSFLASPDGRNVNPVTDEFFAAAFPGLRVVSNSRWQPVQPGSLPPVTSAPGYDENFQPLFVSRARFGTSVILGMTNSQGIGKFAWHGNKIAVEYTHEMLTDYSGLEWVRARRGVTPKNAVQGGCDEKGNVRYFLYIFSIWFARFRLLFVLLSLHSFLLFCLVTHQSALRPAYFCRSCKSD